jgi:hypothetical protein
MIIFNVLLIIYRVVRVYVDMVLIKDFDLLDDNILMMLKNCMEAFKKNYFIFSC